MVDPPGGVLDALRAVVDAVHGRDVGEEGLRGADVRGGLVPPDVLLAGLQGQAVAVAVVNIPVGGKEQTWFSGVKSKYAETF